MIKQPTNGYLKNLELTDASIEQIVLILTDRYRANGKPMPSPKHLREIAERYHHRHHG